LDYEDCPVADAMRTAGGSWRAEDAADGQCNVEDQDAAFSHCTVELCVPDIGERFWRLSTGVIDHEKRALRTEIECITTCQPFKTDCYRYISLRDLLYISGLWNS